MATLNLADGEAFVKGRSMDRAQELLGFAGKERTAEVRTTTGGYIVPAEILPEGYEHITKTDLPAVTTEPGTSTNVDEVYNKGGEPTPTANVSRETEDADADAEAQAQADAEAAAAAQAEADELAAAEADADADADAEADAELYDPSAHNISEVEAYLEEADEDERARVFAAEAAGKNRKGITDLATTPEGAK